MAPLKQSKRSQNKHCTVKVRLGIFMENLPASFIPKSGRKYSHTNSEIFVTTLISEDDNLTAGAWAACDRMENS